jgi:endonuclease/exonuclease/phosphatase family metal-dependent hydrolase
MIAEAIAQQSIDVSYFQEVGEYAEDLLTYPYGNVSSNMAYRIQQKLQFWGIHYHLFQDWSHVGFWIWREGTAILSHYPLHHFKRNGTPMRVKGFQLIFNGSFYPMVSDHYGLVAWFELY